MRVSTKMFFQTGFNAINQHQNTLLDTQEKLSTGKRVNKPSDDPVAMSQIHSLNRANQTIDQYAKNGEYAKSQLVLEETAVSDTVEILQRIRELGIQMSNDTYNAEQRRNAAAEIEQLQLHIKGTMNMKNSEGEYMFSGNNVKDTPFVDDIDNPGFLIYIGNIDPNPANYDPLDYDADPVVGQEIIDSYVGLAREEGNYGGRFVQIGFDHTNKLLPNDEYNMSRVRIMDTGTKVFGIDINDPKATYVNDDGDEVDGNIWNVLEVMRLRMVDGEKPGDDVLDGLKDSITKMSEVLAQIGGRQKRIETQYDAGESFKIALEERRMTIEDMDLVEGISKFTVTQNALQMAQQVFSKVQQMSLFNYIR